ncbi:MAG TPA: DUF4097 family beta strand repeat-containing protein [Vicinamibacterales bacterium]
MRRLSIVLTAAIALACGTTALAQPREGSLEPQQPPIQARPGGPETSPKSDQTVDVTKGTRLVLSNNAGEVVVRSWERDQVRIQATHGARETISAETTDMTLRIRTQRASGSRGPGGLVDYQITVPRWMPVNLSGTYLDATIEGTTAEVTVETVHGNARVSGGNGAVSLRSVEGVITVDKASGRVQATTVNEGIRITNVSGEITAETTNGNIFIDNATTSNLEAFTVNGEVTFNGTIRDNGAYRLGTHNGDIRVGLGGANNATVFVRTFQGDFAADFPVQLPEGQNARSGSKRFNFTLGSGSARIELQSFGGDIVLARKAITSREEERRRRREGLAPVAQPPQPGQPPQPLPAPTPKPPKPPGWDEQAIEEWAESFADEFEEKFGKEFEQTFEQGFETNFEKNFGKEFEKNFEEQFQESLKEWKLFSKTPSPKAKIR